MTCNAIHEAMPPEVACELYLKQWKLLRKIRSKQLPAVCLAQPKKTYKPTPEHFKSFASFGGFTQRG
jgi:hypothetical protein